LPSTRRASSGGRFSIVEEKTSLAFAGRGRDLIVAFAAQRLPDDDAGPQLLLEAR
tara:strand:- start:450 stop:614 length:165 start_codon:yes stop_codon:yes gene_type:complete